jgi:hypothetical protein
MSLGHTIFEQILQQLAFAGIGWLVGLPIRAMRRRLSGTPATAPRSASASCVCLRPANLREFVEPPGPVIALETAEDLAELSDGRDRSP